MLNSIDLLSGKLRILAVSKAVKNAFQFLNTPIESVKQTYQKDSMRNFIDYYLKEIERASKNNNSSFKVKIVDL